LGEYIITEIYQKDLIVQKEEISKEIKQDINSKLDQIFKKAKKAFDIPKLKIYDKVKLLVEDEKYAKFGIHKGEIGVVVDDNAVQDFIEVDFLNFNDSISVNFNDLEPIKWVNIIKKRLNILFSLFWPTWLLSVLWVGESWVLLKRVIHIVCLCA